MKNLSLFSSESADLPSFLQYCLSNDISLQRMTSKSVNQSTFFSAQLESLSADKIEELLAWSEKYEVEIEITDSDLIQATDVLTLFDYNGEALQEVLEFLDDEGAQHLSLSQLSSTNQQKVYQLEVYVKNSQELKEALKLLAKERNFDFALIPNDQYQKRRRLVAFDMDSTLIDCEFIDELAKKAGPEVGQLISDITASAMRGEIDFQESFRKRVGALKGLSAEALQEINENLPLMEGMPRLVNTLVKAGFKTVILSGGMQQCGDFLQQKFGFDHVYANHLGMTDGVLNGEVEGDIVDGQRKAELLELIANAEGFKLEECTVIGDGANDLPMINKAGLGVAFHPKPIVYEQAPNAITNTGLDGLLYLLGFSDSEIEEIQKG